MKRRVVLATGATTLLAGCQGVLGSGSDYDIGMNQKSFDPDSIEVPVGTEVVWKNTSSRAHTITAYEAGIPDDAEYFASGGFDSEQAARNAWDDDGSGNLYGGETFSYTVDVPGTYEYFCIPHESSGMTGTITATESSDSA
ncbi:MAG: plastocyanin/azurin family copper-binding protein [Halapricum sp.]